MNQLGDVPADLLFGLIALNNNLVDPVVIPAALRARALEPIRTLAELLVSQGALTPVQCDLVETLSGEYIERGGGDALKGLATLIANPSARERLDQLGDLGFAESLNHAISRTTTLRREPGPTLDDPNRPQLPPADIGPNSGPQVAGYNTLEVLGAGGMGIVYKAHQERLDRFVALKMIRAGGGARPEDLARFETEAKAVAAIEHNNIIKIFDIGEQDGLPYFSLEYLPGGSLSQRIGGKPQPFDQAAHIVETLARAIHVAHEHKVIHRDLKPANVLFAADGTLKITDFGLVKRLESDSKQTRSGSILGTPSYMAPEQARGESQTVGPAADQYALGAILYDLLTGRPPFQGTSVLDTLEMVRSKEPVAPSQLQPKTPRDLETICLKCLEKDVARRYPDVLALAEDLRRYSAGETILARPVSAAERLWRWCKRNRRVAYLSAAVALLLVVVTLVSVISAVRLKSANTVAEEKRAQAVAAVGAANEGNRNAVDAAVELIVLFTRTLRDVPAIQNVREQTLDTTIGRLSAVAQAMIAQRGYVEWGPRDEENNWRSLARAYQAQAAVSLSRNKFADAMEQFRQVEEIIARLAAADPDDLAKQVNLLKIQRQLGYVSVDRLGDTEGAQKYLRKAVEISRACHAKKPDDDGYKGELANSLGNLAGSEMALGHLEKARELYHEEIAVRESFSPAKTNDSEARREHAGLYAALATLTVKLRDLGAGQKLYDRSALIREQVAEEKREFWPALYDLAVSYNHQGSMRFPLGDDPKAAREFHRKALDVFKKRATLDPADIENKHSLGLTLYYEATCALHSGDKDEAAAGYRECLKICKELDTGTTAKPYKADLMLALARCGDHAGAATIAEKLVATPPKDEAIYVQAACGFALACGVARAAGVSDAALVQNYVKRALECLRAAKNSGWADVVGLETDTDLEPIRNEPAFKTFLDELRQTVKSQTHR